MSAMAEQSAAPKWVRTTLGAVTEEKVSQMGPQGCTEFVYVDISSIDNKTKRVVEPKTLPVGHAPSRAKQNLRAGDVLVSMTRPNLNAVALVPLELDGAVGSTGFHVLRARQAEPSWLFYSVQTHDFIDAMCRLVQGALYPAVRPKDIRVYPVPLPPLDEQRRIVAEIEKQFTRLEAGVVGLRRVQANLKRYRAAVLKAAVEGNLTEEWRKQHPEVEPASELLKRILVERRAKWNGRGKYREPAAPVAGTLPGTPGGWGIASLEQLTSADRVICYGILMPKKHIPNGVLYVKVRDFKGDKVDVLTLQRTSPEIANQYTRASLKAGDLLLAIPGTYGRVAEVPPELEGGNITQDTARLAVTPLMDRRYAAWFLRSEEAQNYFKRVARGVAVKGVNIGDVRPCPVLLPPLAEQEQIVAEVERRLSVVEELEPVVAANLQRGTRLRQAVLQRAFEGKLVKNQYERTMDEPQDLPLAAESPSSYGDRR